MKFPDLPDNERLRRIEKMRPLVPTNETSRMIEEAQRLSALNIMGSVAQEQASLAMAAVGGIVLNERHRLAIQAAEIATAIGPALRERMAAEMASWATSPAMADAREGAQYEINRLMIEMAKTINQIQITATPQILQNLYASNDGPVRLAMETIRSLNLERMNPLFAGFITEALEQTQPLNKETIRKVSKAHLSKKKTAGLSKKQREQLKTLMQILGLLITLYAAILAGRPVTIDQVQFARLLESQRGTVSITQVITQSTPVPYFVQRPTPLRTKPDGAIIFELPEGEEVLAFRRAHQWVYVEYQDETNDVYECGWVNKKYLKKLD